MSSKSIRKWKREHGWMIFPKVKPYRENEDQRERDARDERLQAKTWGHIRTAERLDMVSSPVNRQARFQMKGRKSRSPHRRQHLYLVRFTLRGGPPLSFLKIGITSTDIATRFADDLDRFTVEEIFFSGLKGQRGAQALEAAIHDHFSVHKFRPPVLIQSGNTECFIDDPHVLQAMLNLFMLV